MPTRSARSRSSLAGWRWGDALDPRRRPGVLLGEDLEAKIRVALGGRVAEEVVYGKITTGAESDIEQLTQIARHMVGRWGMSDKIGPIAVLPNESNGPYFPGTSETSPDTQRQIDDEVHRLVDEAHTEVTQLLTEHRDQLDNLSHALSKPNARRDRRLRRRRRADATRRATGRRTDHRRRRGRCADHRR